MQNLFSRRSVGSTLVFTLLGTSAASARTSAFMQSVQKSIHGGVTFELSQEHNGRWDDSPQTAGITFNDGETCLVLEALLSVSQSTNDARLGLETPAMQQAIAQVMKIKPTNTYTAAFQAGAISLLPLTRPRIRVLNADRRYLTLAISTQGAYSYQWTPSQRPNPNLSQPWQNDNSNTQYGVLGMWSIADTRRLGVRMGYWRLVRRHFVHDQQPDGSWFYQTFPDHDTGKNAYAQHLNSMPQAGLASMYLADEYLFSQPVLNPLPHKTLQRGLAYVTKHFDPNADLYSLYGDERVGLYSGLKFFGTTNWFKTAGTAVVHSQQQDGSFPHSFYKAKPSIATAYALLFLARGGVPVVFNKLQYPGPWDARMRDDGNVTEWLSKRYEAPLKWQVVNTSVSYRSWLDAPVLLIAGHVGDGFHGFDKPTIAKLRKFIQAGGLVFSTSDGGSMRWNTAMAKAAEAVVHNRYKMKKLSPHNPLYTMQSVPLPPMGLSGLSNGVRLLWVNSSQDLGAVWQRNSFYNLNKWKIAANLFFYCTSKSSFARRFPDLHVPPGSTSSNLAIARLKFKGNWNPEPAAWPRLAKLAAWKRHIHVTLSTSTPGKLQPGSTPLAVMTGTGKFKFSHAQIKALRKYLDGGGMLLADSAGGKSAFTNSFLKMVRRLYPSHSLHHIPPSGKLYQGIKHLRYRKFFTITKGLHTKPRVLAIKIKGKYKVLFSQDDITSGLLGTHTWGILGYAPSTAQNLALNALGLAH